MKLNLRSNKILEEKFNQELNGYSPNQVDHFLDLIIEDYRTFEAEVQTLKRELSNQAEVIKTQEYQIRKLQLEIDSLRYRIKKMSE